MITNERQHRISRAEAKRFEEAITHAERQGERSEIHPRLHKAMVDGLRSQLDELREEIDQYEALRKGKIRKRVSTSLLDLPNALIEGRIVRGLTQKELGRKLGVAEQQIQRCEATRYAGVSLERLQEVADAVGLKLTKTIEYDVSSARSRSKGRGRSASAASKGASATTATKRTGKSRKKRAAGATRAAKSARKKSAQA
jgi:transcriptional regulator with XRE-family HTH domain